MTTMQLVSSPHCLQCYQTENITREYCEILRKYVKLVATGQIMDVNSIWCNH